MIETAFRQILIESEAVQALIAGRVHFGVKPQNETQACVVLTVVDKQHPHDMDGDSDYTQGRMQVDCFAATYPDAKALVTAVRAALERSDAWPEAVDYIEVEGERDIPVVVPTGKPAPSTFGVSLDAVFQHQNRN